MLDKKIFETSLSIKKVIFIFIARHPFHSKGTCSPKMHFRILLEKLIHIFLKKLLNNKIFVTYFVIKKSYVNFWGKTLPFHQKWSNVSPKQFFTIFSENTFFEKTVECKNIRCLIWDNKKGYIHFWCKMTRCRSHSHPVATL